MNLFFDLDKIIFKKIRHTITLNKKTIDHPGKKFFYSPETTKIKFCLLTMMVILYIYFGVTENKYFLLAAIFFFFLLINMFHKVIFKNPIFIINGDKLYYTKMDKWFDLNKTIIYTEYATRGNFSETLTIELDSWGDEKVQENLWYIEYDKDLVKILKKYLKKENWFD